MADLFNPSSWGPGTMPTAADFKNVAADIKTAGSNRDLGGNALVNGFAQLQVQDKGGQVFNVKAYGAAGNGTTDDTSAIQAALTAGAGAEVVLPAGTYNVNGTLTVPSGTWLRGSKEGATIINVLHATADLFSLTNTVRNTISDLLIVGISKTSGWTINATGGTDLTIESVFTVGMPFGVRLSGVSTVAINGAKIHDLQPSTGIGILVTDAATEVRIHRVIMDNAVNLQPLAGIQVKDSPFTLTSLCEIIRCGTNLLLNPGSGQAVTDYTDVGSNFDSAAVNPIAMLPTGTGLVSRPKFTGTWAAGAGFGLTGGSPGAGVIMNPTGGSAKVLYASFLGCVMIYNRQHGVDIQGGAATVDTRIEHCLIYGNGYAPSTSGTYSAVLIGSNVSTAKISNNYLGTNEAAYQTQASGVQAGAGSGDFLTITDNVIPGSTFAPIFTSPATGLHMIIRDNSPVDTSSGVITSATSVGLSGQPFTLYDVTGTSTITTITEGWNGRQIILVKTDTGSLTVGGGGNIPGAHTMTQFSRLALIFDGSNWY